MHAAATEARSAALSTLLRSLGQIVLQPNAFTGACLLAAWLVSDPRLACAALMGAVAANVSAVLAGYRDGDTRAGLHGFNGALAGLAAFTFIADNATATAVAILSGTATAWLLQPWSRALQTRGLGYFSSPCLIVTWFWMASMKCSASAPGLVATSHFDFAQAGGGVLASLAQTSFGTGVLPGLLVLLGVAASSRRHALWALIGAALASLVLALRGAPAGSFDAGLLGFNGALTAIALADSGILTALGGIAVAIVLQTTAMHLGLPAMTAPFVLATWSMQWCKRRFAKKAKTSSFTLDGTEQCVTPADTQAPAH